MEAVSESMKPCLTELEEALEGIEHEDDETSQ
jgi:hypothetical protein